MPKSPRVPTAKEREEHELEGHIRYRNWCRHCVSAGAYGEKHVTAEEAQAGVRHGPTLERAVRRVPVQAHRHEADLADDEHQHSRHGRAQRPRLEGGTEHQGRKIHGQAYVQVWLQLLALALGGSRRALLVSDEQQQADGE